jgi:hypothetical protein
MEEFIDPPPEHGLLLELLKSNLEIGRHERVRDLIISNKN